MNILPDIKIIDLALYLEKQKTVIIGDLHLGYEEMLNKKGILVPGFQYKKILVHLNFIFSKCYAEKVIIAGDLKHEFGTITEQEWREVLNFLDYLSKKAGNIVLIKGKIFCPLHPKKNKGQDLRKNHCDIDFLCPTAKKFQKWSKKRQKEFLDFIKSKKLDVVEYSLKMDDGELLKEFLKK